MIDLAVIILTGNERLHIGRCLERLVPLEPRQIFVVDCFSKDGTRSIIEQAAASLHLCVRTVEHEWPGNQAIQFNWALNNLPLSEKWVLRLDADEWLTQELIDELLIKLPQLNDDVAGVVLKRRLIVGWLGNKWIMHGIYPTRILRLFRNGQAQYAEDMIMDEHLVVKGLIIEFDNDFVDESLLSFEDWKEKHLNYVKREAQMAVERRVNKNKKLYYKLPPYFRAVAYFCLRYFLKLGFLDGLAGFRWHLRQGLWYRWLVDREIGRLRERNLGLRV